VRPAESVLTGVAFPKKFDWIVLCVRNLPVQSFRKPSASLSNNPDPSTPATSYPSSIADSKISCLQHCS